MVLQIDAKADGHGSWEAYCDGGREHTGFDAVEWAKRGEDLGAGEVLLTSVDREGTCKGFDVDLVRAVSSAVSIPVIASGGYGTPKDLTAVVESGGADAVAIAHMLHYRKTTMPEIRQQALLSGMPVRQF
jgi:cyclase